MRTRTKITLLLSLLIAANALFWLLTWSASHTYALLLSTGLLAYGFGLRHAVDADHISAIDNTTRKLMQEGKRPIGVGFFFSLGHSTVVVLLCARARAVDRLCRAAPAPMEKCRRYRRNGYLRVLFVLDRHHQFDCDDRSAESIPEGRERRKL